MRALTRKLLRDLLHMKGQALAIAVVVAVGVAIFITSRIALDSLEQSRDAYYERYRFADVFVRLRRAPMPVAERIAEIPGVTRVEARVVSEVSISLEGVTEPAIGQLISIPEKGAPELNDLHLRSGRWIEPGRLDEVLLGEAFAQANGLGPGDTIDALINGRGRRLSVVGVALSPEYVYQISGTNPWPDDKRFAVMWMGRDALSVALDMRGAFNDACLSLARGASEPEIIAEVDRQLAPYGSLGAHGRSLQMSDRLLTDELAQLRTTAVVAPAIFLAVAAFLLNVVVSRLVGTQRTQIATLKAFGYSSFSIAIHYLEMTLVLVLAGAALGVIVGLWMGSGLTELYARYFHFPVLALHVTPTTALNAVLVSVASATVGALASVRRAASLPPAEAMQDEPPTAFRRTFVERLGIGRLLSPSGRMILRNVARRPARALLSTIGVACGVAGMVLGMFTEGSIRMLIDIQFRTAQNEDATVFFTAAQPARAQVEVEHMTGVLRAEPFRAVSVNVRSGHRFRNIALTGMLPGAELRRLVDQRKRVLTIPSEGLVLTAELASVLGVRVGDMVTVEVLEGRRLAREVPVVLLFDELLGMAGYMDLHALNRLLGEGLALSGVFVDVDPREADGFYQQIKRTPGVAGVAVREAVLQNFERTMAENIGVMRAFQVVFAGVLAFSIVYNNARIALSERQRELATLRVLGLTRAEVSFLLLGELALITLAAIPLGIALGSGLAWLVTLAYRTEMIRIPFVVHGSTYATASVVVLVTAIVSALLVRRRIDRLDLVGVLKTRD
jgi:putative ABC transport system permease protein